MLTLRKINPQSIEEKKTLPFAKRYFMLFTILSKYKDLSSPFKTLIDEKSSQFWKILVNAFRIDWHVV